MATDLTMPQMGYDMQEGTVVRWLKDEGASVELGEPIAEIETDKAVVEFESYAAGILHRIVAPEGTVVPVGQVIAVVGAEDEAPADPIPSDEPAPADEAVDGPAEMGAETEAEPVAEAEPESAAIPLEAPAHAPPANGGQEVVPSPDDRRTFATPAARKIAEERGIDLATVDGTGPGGRIVKEDVLAAPEPEVEAGVPPMSAPPEPPPAPSMPPTPPPVIAPEVAAESEPSGDLVPLSRMRQQIARVTIRSKSEKPHFYVTTDIDMSQAMALRQQINQTLADEGVRVTVNDLIIRACVHSLKVYPKFNSYYHEEGIQENDAINVGVAIAIEEGLIVPAMLDCGEKSLKELAQASRDLAERAANGTLRPQEYAGGTFAVSNLGMFGISNFVAIIQPPQSAVLAVGAVRKQPVVRDDQVVVSEIMTVTLSGDHRIVDGAEGAQFVNEVKRLLESPLGMLV
ncbi:MAG: 2-oxo acid dehydrogenase subunit E2 [SAR202 cluster bacterium]|jgi:pyruvate dehydrogenase E2 component (dihydrolipoamide acetyltransferase)|nr:dihydrolipoamide acetyltransferase [Chloroflexota bacterium]MDP6420347.1 dihydrolipoamide acetyltransferase family protein [SAR202 cluster bacterium]HAL49172.1 2-oxo acid dehydrogenase subunit E2 [Dehalococcoidia bacterium]MDP6798560.1 dihydrolipoamide acetyltransferase family protein [SAR202 cluster bacterium]MQG56598.1 2-oxo acid dehydrogenase subunit E2 [SAR202 cluster bacterium]|tara:strand:- start:16645 stop:18018 length:1374 start_codon:yes stop_codon:yes gene_type:complete